MAQITDGSGSGRKANVNTDNELHVSLAEDVLKSKYAAVSSISDDGSITGTPEVKAIDSTEDFQLRMSVDNLIDADRFNYAAQNTAKYSYRNTTMTAAWGSGFITTNSGNITTLNTGLLISTYNVDKMLGNNPLYVEMKISFTGTWGVSNTEIEYGKFSGNTANPYTIRDGVFFRVNSAGIFGVSCNADVEQTTSPFTSFTPTLGVNYKFTITITDKNVKFWINDVLYGSLEAPLSLGQCTLLGALPTSFRHAIGGIAASAALNMRIASYGVYMGGVETRIGYPAQMNKMLGSYEGLGGGTMGSLANYANSANPTAALPTNTTAALGSGLGGQFWEIDTLAANTDGIISSYQNPIGSLLQNPRNLVIRGVYVDSFVQSGITSGGYTASWSLAFGHTSVSLGTGEAATTKASRRIPIGFQPVPSGSTIYTKLERLFLDLGDAPIVVAPGQFVATVKKKIGTAPLGGTVAHLITFIYHFE